MKKDIFTIPEIAKMFKLSRYTVFHWVKKGNLNAYRPAKNAAWQVTRKELAKYMKKHDIPLELLNNDRIKILIVDDEVAITSFISKALKKERNFEIDVANSGFKAGIKLAEFKPHIVILDIILGDIDGREFFEQIRENPELKETKVIGISGKIDSSEEQSLLDQGFSDFLRKPFTMKVLKETIYKVLEEA